MNLNFLKLFTSKDKNKEIENNRITFKQFSNFLDYLSEVKSYDLKSYIYITYYMRIAPVFSSIDSIIEEISNLDPIIYDKKNDRYIYDHPLLNLLHNPNSNNTFSQFMTGFASFYMITGNSYLIGTHIPSQFTRPFANLYWVYPQSVNIFEDTSDGLVSYYNYITPSGSIDTFRRKNIDNKNRYFSADESKEFYQAKRFNPSVNFKLYGMPKLMPIYYEIEQYLKSSQHNLSLLTRGGRMSGMFKTDLSLTDKQFQRLQEEIQNFSGASNAGRMGILDNGLDFQELSQNNKDMDFIELKRNVTNLISSTLRIPLPLINDQIMTYSNYETAKLMLYDNAVLPLAKKLFKELDLFLMERYDTTGQLELTFDVSSIPALELRKSQQLESYNKLSILTINEQRSMLGYEPLDGGDEILEPATLVPVASASSSNKQKYIDIMTNQKNNDGSRKYSDEEIQEYVDKYL